MSALAIGSALVWGPYAPLGASVYKPRRRTSIKVRLDVLFYGVDRTRLALSRDVASRGWGLA